MIGPTNVTLLSSVSFPGLDALSDRGRFDTGFFDLLKPAVRPSQAEIEYSLVGSWVGFASWLSVEELVFQARPLLERFHIAAKAAGDAQAVLEMVEFGHLGGRCRCLRREVARRGSSGKMDVLVFCRVR